MFLKTWDGMSWQHESSTHHFFFLTWVFYTLLWAIYMCYISVSVYHITRLNTVINKKNEERATAYHMLLYQSLRLTNPLTLDMRKTVSAFVKRISGSMNSGWLISHQESAPTCKARNISSLLKVKRSIH